MKLDVLKNSILQTLKKPLLSRELVILTCNRLSEAIVSGVYDEQMKRFVAYVHITEENRKEVCEMLSESYLRKKVVTELGSDEAIYFPLGVLLHIGPGNLDGISAFSVIEGLLMGNINILKLPSNQDPISVLILKALMQLEPALKEYIYILNVPSNQKNKLKRLCGLADGVIVWGGDEAISSYRGLVPANTKLIEWGHKISFAYITQDGKNKKQLLALAEHIIKTKQLLCSSCQGIYIDCENESEVDDFCKLFLPILEESVVKHGGFDIGICAQNTLKLYNYEIEQEHKNTKIYKEKNVSLIRSYDSQLENSLLYGNVWVKVLPRKNIIDVLKENRGHLQTVGLICGESEREELISVMIRAGITRIRSASDMSTEYQGDAHDGEYPLRRYGKVVKWNEKSFISIQDSE